MKESDIRPRALFDQYLALLREDAAALLASKAGWSETACPGCGAGRSDPAFEKEGFRYVLCAACRSLFASPRPSRALFNRYYRESRAVRFWSTHFYRETAEARREQIFRPRAREVAALAASDGAVERGLTLVDLGAGFGLFLEEMDRLNTCGALVAVEPVADLAALCRSKGFQVIESTAEEAPEGVVRGDVATAFEVLEHVLDPVVFLSGTARLLRPGGRLLLTTLTVSGFDIQVLWERSRSVVPPQHLNLLSLDGLRRLFERAGFVVEELTTPGRLDVDIVRNAVAEDPHLKVPRFVRRLLEAGPESQEEFQGFLRRFNLSSHVRVLARSERGGTET